MYDTLLRLFKSGKLPKKNLENAITLGWITKEQKAAILVAK